MPFYRNQATSWLRKTTRSPGQEQQDVASVQEDVATHGIGLETSSNLVKLISATIAVL